MKYLILLYGNPAARQFWEGLDAERLAEAMSGYGELDAELRRTGELVVAESLADPENGKRIRGPGMAELATDGPFAEAKEYLAGFYLVDCRDMDRAAEIAARIPEAEHGVVDIRPVRDLSSFGL